MSKMKILRVSTLEFIVNKPLRTSQTNKNFLTKLLMMKTIPLKLLRVRKVLQNQSLIFPEIFSLYQVRKVSNLHTMFLAAQMSILVS